MLGTAKRMDTTPEDLISIRVAYNINCKALKDVSSRPDLEASLNLV